MGADGSDDAAARARALTLLEATHKFPCDYSFTVIAFNREAVTLAVRQAASQDQTASKDGDCDDQYDHQDLPNDYQSRASREGKYLSHKFSVRVSHAGQVLDLYARFRLVDGVVTLL